MQKYLAYVLVTCILFLSLSSCELAGNIFKAGVWSGVLICFLIVALVVFLIAKSKKD